MPDENGGVRRRDRARRAHFPSPGSAAGGLVLVGVGALLLGWSGYQSPGHGWIWCSLAALCLVITAKGFVGDAAEPPVARLAGELQRLEQLRGAAGPVGRQVSGISSLTTRERRRLATARLKPAEGMRWAALYVPGAAVSLAVWLLQMEPFTVRDLLAGVAAIGALVAGGAFHEYFRWQPLLAALRNELGDEAILALFRRSGSEERPAPAGLSAAQREALGRALGNARAAWLIAALGAALCAVEIALTWLAARNAAGGALVVLAACGVATAGWVTGYAVAAARWRPFLVALHDELDERGAGTTPSEGSTRGGSRGGDGGR